MQIKGIEKALVSLKVQFFEESISIMNDNPTFFLEKGKLSVLVLKNKKIALVSKTATLFNQKSHVLRSTSTQYFYFVMKMQLCKQF